MSKRSATVRPMEEPRRANERFEGGNLVVRSLLDLGVTCLPKRYHSLC